MSERSKQAFLDTYDHEHATTMRVLRAYPEDQLDLRPTPKMKTAKELAWVFVLECYLGQKVWRDEFKSGVPSGTPPKTPESWSEILQSVESAYAEFRALIAGASVDTLEEDVHFMTVPKTLGPITRMNWLWFLLHDQIHHRGQFSIYLRMAGGKLPSIYGPTADEPWV